MGCIMISGMAVYICPSLHMFPVKGHFCAPRFLKLQRRSLLVGEPNTKKEVVAAILLPVLQSQGPRTGPYPGPGMLLPQADRHR